MENLAPQHGENLRDWIQRILAFARSVQLIDGGNTMIEHGANGSKVDFIPSRSLFMSPFLPTMVQGGVTLAKGLVEGLEPIIKSGGKSIPISGNAKKNIPAPVLKLDPKQIDAKTQTSYIALEVEADKNGRIIGGVDGKFSDGVRLEVVHTAKLSTRTVANPADGSGGVVAMQALALVVWAGDNAAEIFPIVHHNLGYARTFPNGEGVPRHFFWAV